MNDVIFRMSYKKPFTNERVSEVFVSNAPLEILKDVEAKIAGDKSPSSQKPNMLKQMLEMQGCSIQPYNPIYTVNF